MLLINKWIIAALCIIILSSTGCCEEFTLDIFGNANMDETIDESDIEYVNDAINGVKESTRLSDANNDGAIDENDLSEIEKIIDGSNTELTFLDFDGVTKTVKLPVEKIITTYTYHAWAIEQLGMKDRIVAVDESVKKEEGTVFPDLKELPSIGSYSEYDYEKIIELKPDIVIIYRREWLPDPGIEEKIESALPDCTVFALEPRNMGTFKREISKLAYILCARDAGEELVSWYETNIDSIARRLEDLPPEDKVRVIHIDDENLAEGGTTYRTIGNESMAENMVISAAGGVNLAGDLSGDYIEVDAEWILEENPEVITVSDTHFDEIGYGVDDPSKAAMTRDAIMSRPDLQQVDAVKNGRVYLLHSYITITEWFIGVPYLAKILYPDRFEDLNPEAIHQEFLTRFRGLDYDLNEHGIFVYPPIETAEGLAGVPEMYKEQQ